MASDSSTGLSIEDTVPTEIMPSMRRFLRSHDADTLHTEAIVRAEVAGLAELVLANLDVDPAPIDFDAISPVDTLAPAERTHLPPVPRRLPPGDALFHPIFGVLVGGGVGVVVLAALVTLAVLVGVFG